MAISYFLSCFDCREYISFGKLHWVSASGVPLGEATVDGVYDQDASSWSKRDELFGRTVEGFLIRHRNHELRFVPEGVDELLETDGREFSSREPHDVVSPSGDDIDPEVELANWRVKIKR